MAIDKYTNYAASPATTPSNAFEITPDDADGVTYVTLALNVAESGSVHVTTAGGDDLTVYIAAGIVFPIRVEKVWATGTTATGIIGLY